MEAFSRILQAGGASWADLIEQPGKPARDNAKIDGEAAPKPLSYADLARMGRGVLTDWEQRFLIGVSTQRKLSRKQAGMLRDIRRKIETAEAVRAAGAAP